MDIFHRLATALKPRNAPLADIECIAKKITELSLSVLEKTDSSLLLQWVEMLDEINDIGADEEPTREEYATMNRLTDSIGGITTDITRTIIHHYLPEVIADDIIDAIGQTYTWVGSLPELFDELVDTIIQQYTETHNLPVPNMSVYRSI